MLKFKRLPYTTAAEVIAAFNSGKKFEVQMQSGERLPVTEMAVGRNARVVDLTCSSGAAVSLWAHGSNSMKPDMETKFLFALEDSEPKLPPYVPLPFKSLAGLIAAWKAEPHRLKFVIGPRAKDTPGVYDVLSCTQSDMTFNHVKVMISGGDASDAKQPRYMPFSGRDPHMAVWLVWMNADAAKPKHGASAFAALRAVDLVRDSDKPGIAAVKALPPETKSTPAPTFAPAKTEFFVGLLITHNPDKRSF